MYKCKECNFETDTPSKIANHYQHNHRKQNECYCDKCGKKFKNEKGLKCHTKKACDKKIIKNNINHICPKCNFFIKNSIQKHMKYCDGLGPKNKKPKIERKSLKGISYEEQFGVEKSNEIKRKISEKVTGLASTPEKENERKRKLSIIINKRYEDGWKPKCGRTKKINYEKKDGNVISIDGSWELKCSLYLDSIDIIWNRNIKRFDYINLSGNTSKYTPDFYVKNWDSYIEVKGYETDLDRCKWSQFKYNLLIWNKQKLKELNILNIDISNYKILDEPKYKCLLCNKSIKRKYKTGCCKNCYSKIKKNKKSESPE